MTEPIDIKKKYLVLYHNHLNGTGYVRHQINDARTFLVEGATVKLVREASNQHDPFAIRCEVEGYKIGYIPKGENIVLANLMDLGLKIKGVLSTVFIATDWPRIGVMVFCNKKKIAKLENQEIPGLVFERRRELKLEAKKTKDQS
jgi:hypothetical protein